MDVVSVYRAQAHFDAPLDDVWALVGNPATYPDWWPVAVEIRGETFEVGDVYTQVLEVGGRRLEYSRIIDRRDELKELRWHCPTTGGFQHWLLSDAQGGTFVGHGDGNQGRASAPIPTVRDDSRGLVQQTLGGTGDRRFAPDAPLDATAHRCASPGAYAGVRGSSASRLTSGGKPVRPRGAQQPARILAHRCRPWSR
jgi:hypothetical protein